MSIGDIPRLEGGPDTGFEGVRFGAYFVCVALALWDLSKADAPSGLMPGLATSWRVDEADCRRWIIELRQGVKFHDDTPFGTDAAIWNFESILNNQAAKFEPTRSALIRGGRGGLPRLADLKSWAPIPSPSRRAGLMRRCHFNWPSSGSPPPATGRHWGAIGRDSRSILQGPAPIR